MKTNVKYKPLISSEHRGHNSILSPSSIFASVWNRNRTLWISCGILVIFVVSIMHDQSFESLPQFEEQVDKLDEDFVCETGDKFCKAVKISRHYQHKNWSVHRVAREIYNVSLILNMLHLNTIFIEHLHICTQMQSS